MTEIIQSDLPELARTINRAQANVESLLNEALGHALEAGSALIQAKSLVRHGEWQEDADQRLEPLRRGGGSLVRGHPRGGGHGQEG